MDIRSIIPRCNIKGLAFALKEETHIRDNAAAGHRIKNKIAGFCEIKQGMSYQLGRYSPGPIVSESFIAFVKVPLIPCAKPPAKLFEFFLIRFSF